MLGTPRTALPSGVYAEQRALLATSRGDQVQTLLCAALDTLVSSPTVQTREVGELCPRSPVLGRVSLIPFPIRALPRMLVEAPGYVHGPPPGTWGRGHTWRRGSLQM